MAERVLVAVQRYPDGGGIASIVENYVAELSARYEVHVAIVEPEEGWDARLPLERDRLHAMGYSNLINPLLMPTSLLYVARVAVFLRRLCRRVAPAAVLVQDGLNLPVPALIAAPVGTRVVVMDHGTFTNVHETGWLPMVLDRLPPLKRWAYEVGFRADAPWRALRWRIAVRCADALWYTGEELKPWVTGAGSRAQEYTQTVPADFSPADAQQRAQGKARYGLAADETIFNCVGRLDGEKGLDLILAAASRLAAHPMPWRLVIAGAGSLEDHLRSEITRLGLDGCVVMVGRLDRGSVRELQHASDFHLYAGTFSCGVSICLLEAMAAGVVPIVSNVPRLQERLVGDAGWVVPAGNADALTEAMRSALESDVAERSRRRAETLRRIRAGHAPSVPSLLAQLLADRQPNSALR